MKAVRKIVVLGAGESGVGAALLAQQKGFEVFVSDRSAIAEKYKQELLNAAISFEEQQHSEEKIMAADLVIKSPGIPDTVALIRALVSKAIPVISEIEFASRYTEAMLVAITGSNGKTTTATLLHHFLINAGKKAVLAGNVGLGFARTVAQEEQPDVYVLELSSFQLDGITTFRPKLAALLNITPDHLDRYDYKIENYIDSKCRIALNQKEEDTFWFFDADENIQQGLQKNQPKSTLISLGLQQIEDEKVRLSNDEIIDLSEAKLQGRHNALNTMFAAEMSLKLGIETKEMQQAIRTFQSIPHRMEYVGTINGADYINDTKATNVDAAFFALDAMKKPVVWIAGGTDKGNDYQPLLSLVEEKVNVLICLGEDNTRLREYFEKLTDKFFEVKTAEEAVNTAMKHANAGDVVLLSPACASFDLFKNFAQRGDFFRQAVKKEIEKSRT